MSETVTYALEGPPESPVAVVRLDDGKANAMGHAVLDALQAALDRAEAEAGALLIVGRPGKLSGGYDLGEMMKGAKEAGALALAGGRFVLRLYGFPLPTVVACTGHAMAAGAITLLACDTRIGADIPCKIGMNETAIGMVMPAYGIALAEERIPPTHLARALVQAEVFDAAGAVAAGYLDRIVPADDVEATALAEATRLATLPRGAYAGIKAKTRGPVIERTLAGLAADFAAFDL